MKTLGLCLVAGIVLFAQVAICQDSAPTAPTSRPTPPRPTRSFGPSMGMMRPSPTTAPDNGPTCAIDAMIYEVHLAPDTLGRLDTAALTSAAQKPEMLEKALNALGQTKVLNRIDQRVRLSNDTILLSSSVPVVTNTRTTDTGQRINAVSYRDVGTILNIIGSSASADRIDASVNIEIAAMTGSSVQISDQSEASVFRKATLAYKGPVRPGQPVVILSADAAVPDAAGKAVAYLARIVLTDPQTAPGPAVSPTKPTTP